MPKGWATLEIPVPKEVWACTDCGTISDVETSNIFHVGCVGQRTKPKVTEFVTKKKPTIVNGEIVWINRDLQR
jgi:hypothetical protein